MLALINPLEKEKRISAYEKTKGEFNFVFYKAVLTEIENSAKICQTEENSFEVAEPMFWVNCEENVDNNGMFYYDTTENMIKPIIHEPAPTNIFNSITL